VRLGSRVTLAASGPRLLPRDDADAAAVVARALAADGVALHLDARATAARRGADGTTTLTVTTPHGTHELTGDALLVAAGRRPNVETLALDVAGVEVVDDGIVVDDRFRTANARVFAIGDCIAGGPRFTHAADAMARLAVPNALFGGLGGGKRSGLVLPWCTYTSPEVAHVGRTPDQLAHDGTPHDTITVPSPRTTARCSTAPRTASSACTWRAAATASSAPPSSRRAPATSSARSRSP
jgi:pyruvate/2-oxoglutarate dehydrogenase complex dihydrolipoamide dehydrogenase (E3) component